MSLINLILMNQCINNFFIYYINKMNYIILLIIILIVLILLVRYNSHNKKCLDEKKTDELINKNFFDLIIDVRNCNEYNKKKYFTESINIPLSNLNLNMLKIVPNKNMKILFISNRGYRSSKANMIAKVLGYKNTYYLKR